MAGSTEEWITRENIERFRRKIEQSKSAEERAWLERLLAQEMRKLDGAAGSPAAGEDET